VFIDPKSFTFLDGSTLDFASTLMASGFKWVNPNVKSTCSCGESVQF
jgi:iron-sulfur cluster assembly protein